MATSGSISNTITVTTGSATARVTNIFTLTLNWSRTSYSITSNSSTISWYLTLHLKDAYQAANVGSTSKPYTINFNGTNYTGNADVGIKRGETKTIVTGSTVIPHNADGTKTFNYSFSQGVMTQTCSQSGSSTLDTLPRPAKIISGTDFTDEGNPTIKYENSAGSAATSLQACISFTGAVDDIEYRDISKTGTSYTFNLTSSERAKLWPLLDNGTTATVRFYVKSTFSTGEEFYSYVTNIVTFVNYRPVLSPTVEDINSDTLRLTGDKNTLVRYMSTAYYAINSVARKGTSIASEFVRNGDTYTDPEGYIENVYSNTFYFEATDERGHSTNSAIVFNNLSDKKWIDYVKLTVGFTNDPLTADGKLTVKVSGKYFSGSFGAASNKLTIEYQIKSTEGDFIDWTYVNSNNGIVTPTMDGENYTYTFVISGLDYTKTYELSLRANDELTSDYTITKVVPSSYTLFDWSKEDFAFNIPVRMNRAFMYPQTLLWQGASQMDELDTITLDAPISEQPTGIVLVFSLFRDNAPVDASMQSFFVPRVEVQYLVPDCRHNFILGINSNFSVFGAKYLTISDDSISGFEGNTNSGTAASGITFNNSNFVLRYVIGV